MIVLVAQFSGFFFFGFDHDIFFKRRHLLKKAYKEKLMSASN